MSGRAPDPGMVAPSSGGPDRRDGRPECRFLPEHDELSPFPSGAADRRRGDSRPSRRKHPHQGAPQEQRRGQPQQQRPGAARAKRSAAAAGRRRHRAHRRHARRQARLYGDRRHAVAVRSVGRTHGRDLLHRLCRQERRRHGEPAADLRVQRRARRGVGLPQSRAGRSAHRRVRTGRSRRRRPARGQSADLARLHRSGADRSGRHGLEPAGQARRRQRLLRACDADAGGAGKGDCALRPRTPARRRPNTSWARAMAASAPPRWRRRCSASKASWCPAS